MRRARIFLQACRATGIAPTETVHLNSSPLPECIEAFAEDQTREALGAVQKVSLSGEREPNYWSTWLTA